MLVEVKVKVARLIDNKLRKRTETYLVPDCELFVNAEHAVMNILLEEQNSGIVDDYEIQSLRISSIKETCPQWYDASIPAFIATLQDIFHADDGTEKTLKYKLLLWAENHSQALQRVQDLARQGYDMHIEGIKEVDYQYLTEEENG